MMLFSTGTGLECIGVVGPGLLAGWDAGFWIVGAEVGLLQYRSANSGRSTPLQKQRRRGGGGGGGSARASPVAAPMPKSVSS